MIVQEYLKHASLDQLEAEHGVKARVHGHKVSLNYSQIEAKDEDPIAQECRGLILAVSDGTIYTDAPLGATTILARPFSRFFNLGQSAAAAVDMNGSDTRFYEKMDGTLTILYFDSVISQWHVATRSVPEADLPIDGFGDHTFRTLFEKACKDTTGFAFDAFVTQLDPLVTYMFELTTPLNRIVVEYPDYGITLLGARDSASGAELDPLSLARHLGVPHAPIFRFDHLDEMVDFVSSRDPSSHEGIVVCDSQYRRVKVKNAGYLALNKIRDSVLKSPRGFIELILMEKLDDALPLLSEDVQKRGIALSEAFARFPAHYRSVYDACKLAADEAVLLLPPDSPDLAHEHRKAFALYAQAHDKSLMAPLMQQYQGRTSGYVDWVASRRNKDGTYPHGVLDTVLFHMEKYIDSGE